MSLHEHSMLAMSLSQRLENAVYKVFIFCDGSCHDSEPTSSAWACALLATDGDCFKFLGYFSAYV
eukprot:9368538-Pyramimonas_sp.AAC.1